MRMISMVMVCTVLPLTASAQPGATPYYAQPPVIAPAPVEPKLRLELSLGAASPKGDWKEDMAVETSPSFGLQLGFTVAPNISLFGGFRYVRVQFDEDVVGETDDFELTHRELQLGLRYTSPMSPTSKFFLEGQLNRSTVAASFQGESESYSGVGLGARGGMIFMVDRNIGLGLALSYTSAGIDVNEDGEAGGEKFDDTWLGFDANLSFWF
jgi:hypothetical protein